MATPRNRSQVGTCPFCQQGQLAIAACGFCHSVVALCDECELLWSDVRAIHEVPETRSQGSFPFCPTCQTKVPHWYWLTPSQIDRAGLRSCVVD